MSPTQLLQTFQEQRQAFLQEQVAQGQRIKMNTMNLQKVEDAYYHYTAELSKINRQLALAGIAIIWLLAHPLQNLLRQCAPLDLGRYQIPFIFFCLDLMFDVAHYSVASIIWGKYHRRLEKEQIKKDQNFEAPAYYNRVTIGIYILKIACLIIGYSWLTCVTFGS